MDPTSRWILILVFIALSIWRLARYLRMAIRADATSPGVANNSLVTRLAELLAALVVWLAANAVLWFLLLQLPLLKRVPPILLGTAGIFANFYLIPWARSTGKRFRTYLETVRVIG